MTESVRVVLPDDSGPKINEDMNESPISVQDSCQSRPSPPFFQISANLRIVETQKTNQSVLYNFVHAEKYFS